MMYDPIELVTVYGIHVIKLECVNCFTQNSLPWHVFNFALQFLCHQVWVHMNDLKTYFNTMTR